MGRLRRCLAALMALTGGTQAVFAADDAARVLVRTGNEHYANGRYDDALANYDEAAPAPDDLIYADVLHNQAAAQFKLGRHDEARELWVRVASLKDAAFEAEARFNIGNCHYAEALSALRQAQSGGPRLMDPSGAPAIDPAGPTPAAAAPAADPIASLDRAIENYRDALRLDPELTNARANLELAAKLKKQLEEQAEQQPQSQPSEDSEQGETEDQQQEGEQDQQQQGEQQDQQGEEGENQRDSQGDQQEQEQQQQQEEQQPSGESDEQQDEQQQQEQSSETQQQQPEEAEQAEPSTGTPINLSEAEAERLLQMIRDAEQRRREALRAREAAKQKPVDKDW